MQSFCYPHLSSEAPTLMIGYKKIEEVTKKSLSIHSGLFYEQNALGKNSLKQLYDHLSPEQLSMMDIEVREALGQFIK